MDFQEKKDAIIKSKVKIGSDNTVESHSDVQEKEKNSKVVNDTSKRDKHDEPQPQQAIIAKEAASSSLQPEIIERKKDPQKHKSRAKISSRYHNAQTERRERQKQVKQLLKTRKQSYLFGDAISELKKIFSNTHQVETLSIHINSAIDASKSDQNINSYCDVPHAFNLNRRILVVTTKKLKLTNKNDNIKVIHPSELGAVLNKKKSVAYKKIITSQDCMVEFLKHARVLGPKGLLPNKKAGTISDDLAQLAEQIVSKRVFIKNDKGSVFHLPLGRTSETQQNLFANARAIVKQLLLLRPQKVSITNFIKSVYLCSTMSPALSLDLSELC